PALALLPELGSRRPAEHATEQAAVRRRRLATTAHPLEDRLELLGRHAGRERDGAAVRQCDGLRATSPSRSLAGGGRVASGPPRAVRGLGGGELLRHGERIEPP